MLDNQSEKFCYSIDAAANLMSIGRRSLYREIAAGRRKVAKMGKRTLVPADAIKEWLETSRQPVKPTKAAA